MGKKLLSEEEIMNSMALRERSALRGEGFPIAP